MAISRKIGSVHSPCSFFIGARPEESVPKVRRAKANSRLTKSTKRYVATMRAHPKHYVHGRKKRGRRFDSSPRKRPICIINPRTTDSVVIWLGKKFVFDQTLVMW